ncbi:MAG: RagB/SusD family nutrient uptake outer membrane protein [Prevotella sp.]
MKITSYKPLAAIGFAATLTLSSCIEEMDPTEFLSDEQVGSISEAQEGLLNGITAFMVSYNSWGVDENTSYYITDWGYPCQMFFRDVCCDDIPVYDGSYSYWYGIESATETRYTPYYTYKFYYKLIRNCNNLVDVIDPSTAPATSIHYLGQALTYRALAYLDMARMYEYKRTGIASLDNYADSYKIWGLTVPIVTEKTSLDEAKQNPRAPFTTMYRFILSDLNKAESYLKDYDRSDKQIPDLSVVYGMKARFWLEMGTRFEESASDLAQMQAADADASDGYDALGVSSAADCFRKAKDYAAKAAAGYTPTTQQQWHDKTTGFNTPISSWMWNMSVSQREQIPDQYYNSFIGVISTEPSWGMSRGYNAYRCIGSWLYSHIGDSDWRKLSWISPDDAGQGSTAYAKYTTSLNDNDWEGLPEYSNLKFRPAQGNIDDYYVGLLGSIPLMRMEEMKFIEIESEARLNGVAAGWNALKSFINTYRYTDGSYAPRESSLLSDFINEMLVQKRIEFWGEGLLFFDYKRLNKQVRRKDNDNYKESFALNSVPGYTAPWMNYFILEYEQELDPAIVPNPDSSGSIKTSDDY